MKDLMEVAYRHCDKNCNMCHRRKIENVDLEKNKKKLKEMGVLLEKEDGKLFLSGACIGKIVYDDEEGKGIDLKIQDSKVGEMHVSSDNENVNLKIGGKTFVGKLSLGVNKEIAKRKWWGDYVPLADELKTRIEGIVNNRDSDSVELERLIIKPGSHIPVERMKLNGNVLIGKYETAQGPIESANIVGEGEHTIHEFNIGAPTNVGIEVNEKYNPKLIIDNNKKTYTTPTNLQISIKDNGNNTWTMNVPEAIEAVKTGELNVYSLDELDASIKNRF
jgi:hypothetical protein